VEGGPIDRHDPPGMPWPHPAAMDFHRHFGDADIAGNLFTQATARTVLCADIVR